MPSPSSLLFSTIPIVCLLFNSCFAAPHPCCPGSQHVVALMTNYIGTFSADEAESTVCARAENVVNAIKSKLKSMPKCESPNGGGSRIVEEIDAQLTTSEHVKMAIKNEDGCSHNLGFVRAMFEMAKSAAEHAGKGAEWGDKLTKDFGNQITAINALSTEHTIFLTNVRFQKPSSANSAHKKVPSPSDVRANLGEYSAAN
uniref:Effector protein n=1 Tax=Globodera pallida TaxID=36090 RepID=A0A183C8C5_GLOPA